MRSFPLNHHKTSAEVNPILAAQLRRYQLRQRPAINFRPNLRKREFAAAVPGSIGHPDFDPTTSASSWIPRFLIKYKMLVVAMASLVSLMGITTLYRAANKTSGSSSRLSVLPSYAKSKLAINRLAEAHESNNPNKKIASPAVISGDLDTVTAKASILDTLNSMGVMEGKHTADSVGSVLLMVQDADKTSSSTVSTGLINVTETSIMDVQEQQDLTAEEDHSLQSSSNASHSILMLMSPTEQRLALEHQSQVKATVAYVITLQDCNPTEPVWDGAAVLARSIVMNTIGFSSKNKTPSKYGYKLFAIVHTDAATQESTKDEESTTDTEANEDGLNVCVDNLAKLGYEVLVRENPIHPHEIKNEGYLKYNLQEKAKDYIKLYSYTLTDYPIVVMLDVVTFLLNPLDELFDAMLEKPGSAEAKAAKEMINFHETGSNTFPEIIDAFFTRDYTTLQPNDEKAKVAGFQHGFLVIKPSNDVFQEILKIVEEGKYARDMGWGHKGYGNYLGAMTTKGLLS